MTCGCHVEGQPGAPGCLVVVHCPRHSESTAKAKEEQIVQLEQDLTNERVRLAGVLTQLEGHDDPDVVQGVYGWSLPYERARELRHRLTALTEALRRYGQHQVTCQRVRADGITLEIHAPCSCGLDTALKGGTG